MVWWVTLVSSIEAFLLMQCSYRNIGKEKELMWLVQKFIKGKSYFSHKGSSLGRIVSK